MFAPPFNVRVPVVCVSVPLPLSTPFNTIEFGIVGFEPRGSVQSLLIVFVPVCPEKLIKLNVALLQVMVLTPPDIITVPLL